MLFVIVAITAIVLFVLFETCEHSDETKEPSLYDRLGGIYAIAAVIDKFSDDVINDPLVGIGSPNKYLREWSLNHKDRLPGLKFMRTLWVASIAGGPYKYIPTKLGKCPFGLENAHNNLQISPQEFDRVANILSNTLDRFSVPNKEKIEVLSAFSAHKSEVNQGFFMSHGMRSIPITCS